MQPENEIRDRRGVNDKRGEVHLGRRAAGGVSQKKKVRVNEREKESVIRNNPGFSDWSGVPTGERCQPTRGVINPHRSAGRHLFRSSYYSFYKTARTKRHRSYSTAENKPELEVKGLKKGRQSTHTSKSGVSIINNMVQTE